MAFLRLAGGAQSQIIHFILSSRAINIDIFNNRWTNYQTVGGRLISVPKTAHVTDQKETRIPIDALNGIKG